MKSYNTELEETTEFINKKCNTFTDEDCEDMEKLQDVITQGLIHLDTFKLCSVGVDSVSVELFDVIARLQRRINYFSSKLTDLMKKEIEKRPQVEELEYLTHLLTESFKERELLESNRDSAIIRIQSITDDVNLSKAYVG